MVAAGLIYGALGVRLALLDIFFRQIGLGEVAAVGNLSDCTLNFNGTKRPLCAALVSQNDHYRRIWRSVSINIAFSLS